MELNHYLTQCLKLMVTQQPLATKHLAGPVEFDTGQVKNLIDYIRREIFLGHLVKILVWKLKHRALLRLYTHKHIYMKW